MVDASRLKSDEFIHPTADLFPTNIYQIQDIQLFLPWSG